MRETALTFAIVGVAGIVMAGLTALEVAPTFISGGLEFGPVAFTTAFWGGLAALFLLAAIAFGVISSPGAEV